MKNIHAMAGGSVGYVRGLDSVRCGGVAFPVDLVRVVVKTAARMVLRRRMAQAFDGYLVTEQGPPAAVVDPLERAFSGRRWMYEFLPLHCAGDHFRDSEFLPWARGVDRGALDAAPYIAAGSAVPLCVLSSGVVLAQTSVIKREALQ